MEKITKQALKNVIDTRREASILDVRTLREYIDFSIKNIPFIPLELLDHIQHPEAKWNKSKPVYVISYAEARAKAFCHKLEALGYRTFYIKEGGVKAWCRKNLSIINIIDLRDTDKSALLATNGTGSDFVFNFKILKQQAAGWANYLNEIISIAWVFEKMNCNIKFVFEEDSSYFENSTPKVLQESSFENCIALRFIRRAFGDYSMLISSEYAYSVMSRLTINKKIQEQADEWVRANLKGNWIGVHFRGTDLTKQRSKDYIEPDTYISYLKKVVAKNLNIFACSDQAQFIDKMHEAFPDRVFARSIRRSYDQKPLHRRTHYKGPQQKKDALIDILILSKADLIYKTGGRFSNSTRYFNPEIKIITPNKRWCAYISENFVGIPKADLPARSNF